MASDDQCPDMIGPRVPPLLYSVAIELDGAESMLSSVQSPRLILLISASVSVMYRGMRVWFSISYDGHGM